MSVMGKIIFGFLAIISLAAVNGVSNASAFSSNPKTFVSGDNAFYAYVESGEKVSVNFNKSDQKEPSGIKAQPITVTADAPGMAQQSCVIPVNVPVGGGCSFNIVAVKNGVWRINFQLPAGSHVHSEVAASVKWNANLFNWNITVTDNGVEKKGRLWSELYAIRQPPPPSFLTDLSFYYMSEDGYLYRVIYRGYNGQLSTLSADAFGIVKKGGCVTAYQSIATSNAEMTPSFGSCGGSYKLFFEQPSDDLPTSANKWDDTKEWVRPNIDRPLVDGLKFLPDQATDRQSGDIIYTLKNFVGQYEVRIDTNGDGNYDGPNDITLKRQIKNLKSAGQKTIKFDGMDHGDKIIPRSQQINIKINIVKTGEIHLVGADIEGREGGIELVRLSGDNVPTFDVCWNDSELGSGADGLGSQIVLDGTTCPTSTGGVHKWKYSTNEAASWGNARYIDDWVFTSARVKGASEIKYPQELAAIQEDVARRNVNIGIIVAAVVVVLVIIGIVIIWIRRRHKHDGDNLLPPSGFPPNQAPPTPPTTPPAI